MKIPKKRISGGPCVKSPDRYHLEIRAVTDITSTDPPMKPSSFREISVVQMFGKSYLQNGSIYERRFRGSWREAIEMGILIEAEVSLSPLTVVDDRSKWKWQQEQERGEDHSCLSRIFFFSSRRDSRFDENLARRAASATEIETGLGDIVLFFTDDRIGEFRNFAIFTTFERCFSKSSRERLYVDLVRTARDAQKMDYHP